MSLRCARLHGRARWRMSDDLAGRRGIGTEDDRPLQRRDRRGHHFDGAQTVLILMPGHGSDAGPLFLPRAHGVASLRALVALASRTRPPIDLSRTGHQRPSTPPVTGMPEGVAIGGAPSGEAQESLEQCGSATDRRCDGLPSGTRPRSRAGDCRGTAGGQGLAVTRGPLLGREKLWRASIGGKAHR